MGIGMMMGASYPREASALFARMTTPPTSARKKQISKLITALKKAGVWSKLDVLYLLAAADTQAALLNWKSTSYNATNNGATFTADRGYTGNGSSAYINTGYKQGNGQSTTASFALGAFVRTVPAGSWRTVIGAEFGPTDLAYLQAQPAGLTIFCGSSTGGAVAVQAGLSGNAHLAASRLSTAAFSGYRNGLLVGSSPTAMPTAVNANFYLLARNDEGTAVNHHNGRIAAAYLGAGLSADDMAVLDDAVQTYLTAVGA